MLDVLFFVEIIQNFLTAIKDTDSFDYVYKLKTIAIFYVLHGSFFVHFLAAFPYMLFCSVDDDPEENLLRNLLMLKMLRLSRLSTDFIPDEVMVQLMQLFYKPDIRDDRIASERMIISVIKIVKQIMTTLVTTYFLALLWYRFSDNWQSYLIQSDNDDKYFVVVFGLRPPSYKVDADSPFAFSDTQRFDTMNRMLFDGEDWDMPERGGTNLSLIHERLITCMYYALTTLATVGYGDYYPCSIAEKIVGSVI